jgi:hypothetical protein
LNKNGVYPVYLGKETMKAEVVTLMVAIALSMSPAFAQEKFQVAEVDQTLANPDQYRGLSVALHGIVDKVTLEQKNLAIIDSKSGSRARGPNAPFLAATVLGGSQIAIPQAGQEAILTGHVEKKGGVTNFIATQVFTNKVDVQQILAHGSVARPSGKRPGDNLGRDAQPSRD